MSEPIMKRLEQQHKEIELIEKKKERIEFMSGVMGAHQHRVSLLLSKSKIAGSTERVQGHVHKVDANISEDGGILAFTGVKENHKHRIKFTVKSMAQAFKAKKKAEETAKG